MVSSTEASKPIAPATVPMAEAVSVFARIGLLSFGGPAGQIALMHRVLVEEKAWLGEKQFLHALNFCMLLPGPEAMQLATYCGWLMHGVRGGLIAGALFVLPGFAVLLVLSAIYALYGNVSFVEGLLFGLQAAVLAIVVQALVKVARRALHGFFSFVLAFAAFIALAVFQLPFPLVILLGAITGFLIPNVFGLSQEADKDGRAILVAPVRHIVTVLAGALVFWVLPVLALLAWLGRGNVFVEEALFFSKTAMVTFGGAYAVLAYVGQQAVEIHSWLKPDEMLAGLGLAETTPGPLILVLVFVGFLGAFRDAGGLDPLTAGILGATVTTWVTFVPCFIWIFLGAPFIENLRGNRYLASALAAITAVVVGVIANLSVWFALHVLFQNVGERQFGIARIWWPDLNSIDWQAAVIVILSSVLVWRGVGLFPTLGVAVIGGLVFRLTGI